MGGKYNEVTPLRVTKKKQKKPFVPPNAETLANPAAWPPSLQNFVNQSFQQSEALDSERKAQFGTQIQALMQLAIAQNKVWTNPWQLQQLPVFNAGVPLDLYQNITPAKPSKRSQKFDSDERKLKRMARFADSNARPTSSPSPGPSSGPIVGYSQALEKRYLRLTSEPDPAVVRPQNVLEQSLDHVMEKYVSQNAGYSYINDQLKAIRQDLTVQHIKNEVTIKVYKTHGRLAIINNDLGEFNQCSSQLKQIYSQRGDAASLRDSYEFMCYRVLYLLLTGNHSEVNVILLGLLKSDSLEVTSDLTGDQKEFRAGLYRSLDLLTSMTLGDYHGFFETYSAFRNNGLMKYAFHLMKHSMAAKQRLLAINTMCKAFKKLPIVHLAQELALDESEPIGEFLASHNLQQFHVGADFDCGAARLALQTIVDKGNFRKVDIKGQI